MSKDIFIESKQHRVVKEVSLLREKKREREKRGLFLVEGLREIERALACGFEAVYAVKDEGCSAVPVKEVPTYILAKKVLGAVFVREEHGELLMVFRSRESPAQEKFENSRNECGVWVALFDCEKPQNLGAIARSAAAFGAEGLITVGASVDPFSPHTIRASLGAIFALQPFECSRETFWQSVKTSGRRTIAAALGEKSVEVSQLKVAAGDIIILGNEGHGLSPEDLRQVHAVSHIPMKRGQTVADSLNLSNAAAIYLYECSRQLGL